MAPHAEGDQVLLGIVATMASKFVVVDVQIGLAPAELAPPAVAAQYLLAESFVQLRIEAQPGAPWLEFGS